MNQDHFLQRLVPAVERAAGILDIVAGARRFLTLSELARETGLPKSTVHSLCTTMVQLGMLIRRPDQTYILGPHLLRWSNAFERQTDVATEFAALWDQTAVFPDATVTLGVPEKDEVVFIASRQSASGNRFAVRPGARLSAAFCAAGQAILARSSDFEVRKTFADGFPTPMTEKSAKDIDQLLGAIRTARAQGYALEEEQSYEGITSLGAVVLNSLNRPLAAVMVSVPTEMFLGDLPQQLTELVLSMSDRLSRRMGADLQPESRPSLT